MKITTVEIEATAEELKASNTVAGGLANMLRQAFNYCYPAEIETEEDEPEEDN